MLSVHFDVGVDEQVLELARYLEEANPEASGLTAETEQQIGSAETPEAVTDALTTIISKMVACSSVLFKLKEAEISAPFYALSKLCDTVNPEQRSGLLLQIAQFASADSDKPQARARVLAMIFNMLDVADPKRYDVYLMLVHFCGKAQMMGAITAQIEQQLEDWLREWSVDADQTRALYKAIADSCKACGLSKLYKKYIRIFLKSLNGAEGPLVDNHKADARTCVADAIADKDTYQFDDLLELDAIKALAGEPVHKLLMIFINGDVAAFKELRAQEPSLFETHSLNVDECLRKIRLLTLVSLATDTAEVAYADVQSALGIEEKEVDMWIIDAIRGDLVDARMDQLKQKMIVRRAMRRTFGTEDWQRLSERLDQWTASVGEMMDGMGRVKEQLMYKRGQ